MSRLTLKKQLNVDYHDIVHILHSNIMFYIVHRRLFYTYLFTSGQKVKKPTYFVNKHFATQYRSNCPLPLPLKLNAYYVNKIAENIGGMPSSRWVSVRNLSKGCGGEVKMFRIFIDREVACKFIRRTSFYPNRSGVRARGMMRPPSVRLCIACCSFVRFFTV